ncbi:putative Ig domain-containing protein [Patescibacteria group bacterium]
MKSKTKLKYVARKGRSLELEDLSKGESGFRKVFTFVDRLLFKKPVRSFSMLILLVALPVSLYLSLRDEGFILTGEALSSKLSLTTSQITDILPNKQIEFDFEAWGYNTEVIKLIEVTVPSWLGSSTILESGDVNRYKYITYSGQTGFDTNERFTLLAKGIKTSSASECSGCDKDCKYIYALSEFNLNTKSCENIPVWGRNPLGINDVQCQKFENECLRPTTWEAFNTKEECENSQTAPKITNSIGSSLFTFDVDCNGKVVNEPFKIDSTLSATDPDGDVVRFTVLSEGDFINVSQDSVETIIKDVSGQIGKSYSQYVYSAILTGEVPSELIGKTTTIKVNACDMSNHCSESDFDISAVRRCVCDFVLPETGAINVDISYPTSSSEYKGIDNVVWQMSGDSEYYVEVNLRKDDCRTYIQNIARFERLSLNGSKGYAASWDSRGHSDGEYCIQVLAREDDAGSNWDASDRVIFNVRNNNQNPEITSNPSKTNLVTGEQFEYNITATDPDSDQINYDIVGLPSWLKLEGQKISGSTVTPGSYNFAVFIEDGHGGYDTQQVVLNVNPPQNQASSIKFVFPVKDSVLSGGSNTIKWEASDNDGISQILLFYSQDGKSWIQIGTYSAGTSETNWDVSSITNGTYLLKLTVTDNSSQKVEGSLVSESFYIANEDPEEEEEEEEIVEEDTSMPAINNLTPKPDSEIYSKKPLISASLHASNNAEIVTSNIKVYFNDEEISSICEIDKSELSCQVEEDLELARHKIQITLEDSKDKSITEEWYFTIVELEAQEEVGDDTGESDEEYITIPILNTQIRKSALTVSVALCCGALILIAVPWLVYYIWSKRSGNDDFGDSEVVQQPDQPIPPLQPMQEAGTEDEGEFYTRQGYPETTPVDTQTQQPQSGESQLYSQPNQEQELQNKTGQSPTPPTESTQQTPTTQQDTTESMPYGYQKPINDQ